LTEHVWSGSIRVVPLLPWVVIVAFVNVQAASTRQPACVHFASGRIAAGQPYVAPLQPTLDFVLGDNRYGGWTINVMSRANHTVDYVEIVSPPLQLRPHLEIGQSYGRSLRESLMFSPRRLRFVTNEVDPERAEAALAAYRAGEADNLDALDRLPLGRLTVWITGFKLRSENAIDWITVSGESCVPQ